MGYFRTRISRQRCASQVARAVTRQARADLAAWHEAPAIPPRGVHRTFLRFAVGRIHSRSSQQLGVFQAAYDLRRLNRLDLGVRASLRPALNWFGEHLKAPDVPSNAIFWFRFDAEACVQRIWEIVHVLKSHDVPVWMMQCGYAGRIVYHDAFQVAAVPDAARAWRRRQV